MVLAADAAAQAAGFRVGIPATKAQALVQGLIIQDADPAKDGRIIAAMADEKLIGRNPNRRLEDFEGLFTLETLFNELHESPPANNC